MDGRNSEFPAVTMGKHRTLHNDPPLCWPPVLDYILFIFEMSLLDDLKAAL